jgi:rhodanese-related sulfurtransferase
VSAPEVSAAEVFAGLTAGHLVAVDVRTPEEWEAGHIAGAVWIPMFELGARLGELRRDARLAIVCRSGARSGVVADHLHAAGFDAVNMAGGMEDWVRVGLPIEPADGFIV